MATKQRSVRIGCTRRPDLWRTRISNGDPLDFVERDLVRGAVVELAGPRRLVRRDVLGVLQGAAVLEVRGSRRNQAKRSCFSEYFPRFESHTRARGTCSNL